MKDFVTEAEAKQRWCPYARAAEDDSTGSYNRGDDHLECMGSQCMAWRWSHKDDGPTGAPTGFCGAFGLPKYV